MVSIASLNAVQTARPDTHSFGRSLKSFARNERIRIQSSVGSVMGMVAGIGNYNEGMNQESRCIVHHNATGEQ